MGMSIQRFHSMLCPCEGVQSSDSTGAINHQVLPEIDRFRQPSFGELAFVLYQESTGAPSSFLLLSLPASLPLCLSKTFFRINMDNPLKPGVTFLLFIFRLQNYPSLGFEPVVLFEVAGSIPIRAIGTSLKIFKNISQK